MVLFAHGWRLALVLLRRVDALRWREEKHPAPEPSYLTRTSDVFAPVFVNAGRGLKHATFPKSCEKFRKVAKINVRFVCFFFRNVFVTFWHSGSMSSTKITTISFLSPRDPAVHAEFQRCGG